jgi:hypothetical protein
MRNGDGTCKRCGLGIATLTTVRELNAVRFQYFRCEQSEVFNLAMLPLASDAPSLGAIDVTQSASIRSGTGEIDWRRGFFQDAFYTLVTTTFLIALFSALVASIE